LDNLSGTYNEYNRVDYGGNLSNDIFGFTYATIHLDLFSDDKVILQNRYLAMIETDPTMIGDEDYDMVFDIEDECYGTPYGVEVDTLGCPLDIDNDGIPDYLDLEKNSPEGSIVDDNGVSMTDDQVVASLNNSDAVRREEVELILINYSNRSSYRRGPVEVPVRFRTVDKDSDGYISFEEVLDAIDSFFDLESDLSTQEIYELNDFFFSQ
jgi:Ca2+-binding EF-hand superfamily protein